MSKPAQRTLFELNGVSDQIGGMHANEHKTAEKSDLTRLSHA